MVLPGEATSRSGKSTIGSIAVTAIGSASVNHQNAISVVTAAQARAAFVKGTSAPETFTKASGKRKYTASASSGPTMKAQTFDALGTASISSVDLWRGIRSLLLKNVKERDLSLRFFEEYMKTRPPCGRKHVKTSPNKRDKPNYRVLEEKMRAESVSSGLRQALQAPRSRGLASPRAPAASPGAQGANAREVRPTPKGALSLASPRVIKRPILTRPRRI